MICQGRFTRQGRQRLKRRIVFSFSGRRLSLPKKNPVLRLQRRSLILIFLGFLSVFGQAEITRDRGLPIFRNFQPEEYNAHPQNWAAVQDPRGILYVGNGDGVLEYDGRTWTLIPVSNSTMVRSLAVSADGRIWVGASGDFGFLSPDRLGKTVFTSLLDRLPSEQRDFSDVWKVYPTSHGVYFITRYFVFRFVQDRMERRSVALLARFGCLMEDVVFLPVQGRGICALLNGEIIPLPESDGFETEKPRFVSLVDYPGHQLLMWTSRGKAYRYDVSRFRDDSTGLFDFKKPPSGPVGLETHPSELAAELQTEKNMIYCALHLGDGRYALGIMGLGIYIMDRDGRVLQVVNRSKGLPDDSILSLSLDREGNLWAMLNRGLTWLEINSPLTVFGETDGLTGLVTSMIRHQGRLYVGTFDGVFVLSSGREGNPGESQRFQRIESNAKFCAEFLEIDGTLLIGMDSGIFKIEGRTAHPVILQSQTFCFGRTGRFPGFLFSGQENGLGLVQIDSGPGAARPRFSWKGLLPGIPDIIRRIVSDPRGNLWLTSQTNGVIRLEFTGATPLEFRMTRFGPADGLSPPSWNWVFAVEGRILAGSAGGLRVYDPGSNRFEPENTFGRFINEKSLSVVWVTPGPSGEIIIQTGAKIFRCLRNPKGDWTWDDRPWRQVPPSQTGHYRDPEGMIWMPASQFLYRYDPTIVKDYQPPFQTLIRRVTKSGNPHPQPGADSLSPYQTAGAKPELKYIDNNLRFEYAALSFGDFSGTRYQSFLEDFDSEWSDWKADSFKEYTNLPEGNFRFRVRARNLYGHVSRDGVFEFSIRPPWFRTLPAYLAFLILAVLVVRGIVKLVTLRLKRDNERLEKIVAERTQQLKDASLTDPLTRLRNRRFIEEILCTDIQAFINQKQFLKNRPEQRRDLSAVQVFGFFQVDIDHFKEVNDRYGHEAGDEILRQLAELLGGSVRVDDAVMRMGGEEFLVVLKKTMPEYLPLYAEKIRRGVEERPFTLPQGRILRKTISIGYAGLPVYADQPRLLSFEQTIILADLGLYAAKKGGRNRAVRIKAGSSLPADDNAILQMVGSLDYALRNKFLEIEE